MSGTIEYVTSRASASEIAEHLTLCDSQFVPPLSSRVDIGEYASKIAAKALVFEAWSDRVLVGLVASYCDDAEKNIGFITNVSVLEAWRGKGIARRLVEETVSHARQLGLSRIGLQVAAGNTPAIELYKGFGFVSRESDGSFIEMDLVL